MQWCVNIFGKLPDQINVEAATKEAAEEIALQEVLEELNFEAEPDDDKEAQDAGNPKQ